MIYTVNINTDLKINKSQITRELGRVPIISCPITIYYNTSWSYKCNITNKWVIMIFFLHLNIPNV